VPGAGNPQNLNRYAYVSNNPLSHIDPTGHCLDAISFLFCAGTALKIVGEFVGLTIAGTALGVAVYEATKDVRLEDVQASAGHLATMAAQTTIAPLMWAMDDMGPDYSVPAPYVEGAVQTTYPLPGTNTVTMGKRAKEIFIPAFTGQDNTGRGKFSQPFPKDPRNVGAACKSLMLPICAIGAGLAAWKAIVGKTTEQPGGAQPLPWPTSAPTSTPFAPLTPIPTQIPFLPPAPLATYTPIPPIAPTSMPFPSRHYRH
jgi:hypothetical protein